MPITRMNKSLSIAQGMILVAALALGFAWVKAQKYHLEMLHVTYGGSMSYREEELMSKDAWSATLWVNVSPWLPCLATSTVALALMTRLGQKRGVRRRLSSHAGFVGCVGASVILMLEVLAAVKGTLQMSYFYGWVLEHHGHHSRFVWSERLIPDASASSIALGIVAVWTVLLVSGRWRIGSSWVDRLGLGVSILWLLLGSLEAIAPWNFIKL